jgi:phage-related protein
MFKKILLISLILLSFYSTTFSYSKEEVRISYDKFYEKLEKKIISNTKKVVLLKSLENKLDTYLSKSKNIKNIELLTNLKELNSSKIKYLT